MNNLISDIIIGVDYKSYEIITFNNEEICNILPPRILNSTNQIIGYSLPGIASNLFNLHLLTDDLDFTIEIGSRTVNTSNSFNETSFSKNFTRVLPQILFSFPDTVPLVDFKNGITIEICISKCIEYLIIPLNIQGITINDRIITDKNIVYDSNSNDFFFIRGNNTDNIFKIQIIPGYVLNTQITLTTTTSPYYNLPSDTFIYTTLTSILPLTIYNSEYTLDLITSTYTRDSILKIPENTNYVTKLLPNSSDCVFTYTLNNFNTLFEIDLEGNINIIGLPQINTEYILDIDIIDSFMQQIKILIPIVIYDIFDQDVLCSNNKDTLEIFFIPCKIHSLSIIKFESSNIISKNQVGIMISHIIDTIIQSFIMINYSNISHNIDELLEILYKKKLSDFMTYYELKLNTTNQYAKDKLSSLTRIIYPFFRNYFMNVQKNKSLIISEIETPFGSLKIRTK